jgi:hypothetical protein
MIADADEIENEGQLQILNEKKTICTYIFCLCGTRPKSAFVPLSYWQKTPKRQLAPIYACLHILSKKED